MCVCSSNELALHPASGWRPTTAPPTKVLTPQQPSPVFLSPVPGTALSSTAGTGGTQTTGGGGTASRTR